MPCEPSGEHADVCDEDPGLGGSDGAFEVLCQSSASSQPCEGSLHDPTARQDLEALGAIRSLDDFQRELADLLQGVLQFRSGIAAPGSSPGQA